MRVEVSVAMNAQAGNTINRNLNGVSCYATVNIGPSTTLSRKGKIVFAEGVKEQGDEVQLERCAFMCEMR